MCTMSLESPLSVSTLPRSRSGLALKRISDPSATPSPAASFRLKNMRSTLSAQGALALMLKTDAASSSSQQQQQQQQNINSSSLMKMTAPKRSRSNLINMARKPLTRNGRSTSFPIDNPARKMSSPNLAEMRNALVSSSSCRRLSLSSQALKDLVTSSSISSRPSNGKEVEPDETFFQMINFNPMIAEERAQYDDLAVKKYIRRHPEALCAKYDFPLKGKLTVARYPLTALVALGASLATIRLAIKANPQALKASTDFHSTALHTACSCSNTDMEVVRYIYNKYPEAIRQTTKLVYLPLHNACQASTHDKPLLEQIQFLVEEYPEALMAINKLGDTPLRLAQRNKNAPQEVLDFLEEETGRVFSMEENQSICSEVTERQSWGSEFLTLAAKGLDYDDEEEEETDDYVPPFRNEAGLAA